MIARHSLLIPGLLIGLAFLAGCGSGPLPPKLNSVNPAPGERGKIASIKGENLNPLPETRKVMINGVEAKDIVSWGDDTVMVKIPAEAAGTGKITIEVNGQTSNTLDYIIKSPPPVLKDVTPAEGAVGTPVVITGSWLGDSPGKLTFGGVPAEATKWSQTRIEATVPKGATPGPISVKVGDLEANLLPFTLAVPTIRSLSPEAASEGKPFTIKGVDLGSKDTGQVLFDTEVAKIEKWTEKQIDGFVPKLPANKSEVLVKVVVNGVSSTSRRFTVPSPPQDGVVDAGSPAHDWMAAALDADGYPRIGCVSGSDGSPGLVRWDGLAYNRTAITDPSFKSGNFLHLVGYCLDMKLDPKNTSHLAAIDFYDSGIVYMKVEDDGKVTVERVLASGRRDLFGLSIALDAQNNPVVLAFSESQGTKFYTRGARGWTEEILDANGGEGVDTAPPRCLFDKKGRPNVVYHEARAGNLIHAVKDGGQWKKTIIDPGPGVGEGLSLAQTDAGDLVVAYRANQPQPALKIAIQSATGWALQTADQVPGAAFASSVVVDKGGKIHVVHAMGNVSWSQEVQSGKMIRKKKITRSGMRYVTNSSGTWAAKALPPETNAGSRPSIAQDVVGRRMLAFIESESKQLRVMRLP